MHADQKAREASKVFAGNLANFFRGIRKISIENEVAGTMRRHRQSVSRNAEDG
jgi:hypothetical protein